MAAIAVPDRSLVWQEEALMHLLYFLPQATTEQDDEGHTTVPIAVSVNPVLLTYPGLTAAQSLVHATLVLAEHGGHGTVQLSDVLEAARLLGAASLPPRWGLPVSCCGASAASSVEAAVIHACFQLLQHGRGDAVPTIVVRSFFSLFFLVFLRFLVFFVFLLFEIGSVAPD